MKNILFIRTAMAIIAISTMMLIGCQNQTQQVQEPPKADTVLTHVDWSKSANIYEVNLRQHTMEGTIKAFQADLPRLKAMGVDILWLMPIFPIGMENRKGSMGSYYAVADYTHVNPEFGTLADIRSLVDEAHQLGMFVILDWVANHSAWDHPWAKNHPEWYKHDSTGAFVSPFDWTDVIAFDYENTELRDSMISALKFWIKEADVDGYRCDVAGMVPVDFWNEARLQLEQLKPVFMLAENEDVPALLKRAFDMNYSWTFHHIMNQIAQGKKPASEVWKYVQSLDTLPPDAYHMLFITNHDENSWNGTIAERLGEAGDAMAVLTYTFPGMPLIYSGQEAGMSKRLEFFEKDPIDWSQIKKESFYTLLNKLKTDNEALWNGLAGGDIVALTDKSDSTMLAFSRERNNNQVVVIMNLSKKPQKYTLSSELVTGMFMNPFTNKEVDLSVNQPFDLKPWEYLVFVKK
ncbi:MAG: alpha-amylase family glycosyl hydrolase [Bacteroidales bacterium]|jgi:glycosidase